MKIEGNTSERWSTKDYCGGGESKVGRTGAWRVQRPKTQASKTSQWDDTKLKNKTSVQQRQQSTQ